MASARAAILRNYVSVALDVGLDPYRILADTGVSPSQLRNPEERLPRGAIASILERSAIEGNCPHFAMLLAERQDLSSFGPISLVLQQQETLEDAIRMLVRYQHLLGDLLTFNFELAGDSALVRTQIISNIDFVPRQAHEAVGSILSRAFTEIGGERWKPDCLHFMHAAPRSLEFHHRILGCPVVFGSDVNGIVYSREALRARNPSYRANLAAYANSYFEAQFPSAPPQSQTDRARQALYLLLASGNASIESVARHLSVSPRTLQRRLEAEGTGFSAVLNAVRKELVVRHLLNNVHALATVGEMLGYTSPAAFTRWFSSEFGMSPSAWRRSSNDDHKDADPPEEDESGRAGQQGLPAPHPL
ncbi:MULTISPECIES: AraC family transcriptional regulator ligand-binding domain-containing protein [unclassified Sphingomonas]|uniref:AraC family transcriptional regulator ligand-binding domain-containing protein n=1 Tax=unclassified Sphingomonas TaxID=196159 RepID=UPI0022B473C3|nr:AraC family transcriptional regulator ligand-binding domain-containing protein [Sphingomonas sp. NIBR02145]WHU03437.1 AraC family transcriptional regulator ligand-binding domain-containing protein [Sphingomonas sp. NIBR02145]